METGYVLDINGTPFATIETENRTNRITLASRMEGNATVNARRVRVSYAKKWHSYERNTGRILDTLNHVEDDLYTVEKLVKEH